MNHIRHSGIFDASSWPVTLIGAGGIGAITAITLAKMGIPRLAIFDDDRISPENLPTQFFPIGMLGWPKVTAAAQLVEVFSDETAVACTGDRLGGQNYYAVNSPVIVSAVDSIASRQAIWRAIKSTNWLWYLDARMGAEVFQLYSVAVDDCEWYGQVLAGLDESDVPDDPCTAKATIYTGCLAAAYIGRTVRQIITGRTPPRVLINNLITDGLVTIPA